MDARTEDQKQKVSWTHALRQIVINCYKFHGREDLLPAFSEEDHQANAGDGSDEQQHHVVVTKAPAISLPSPPKQMKLSRPIVTSTVTEETHSVHYTPTVVQTISNPDGTVSIIQVDPTNPIITLPDGTTAQVQGLVR
jgi:nuclear respiratory factor 1